jgi:hypothetical protein
MRLSSASQRCLAAAVLALGALVSARASSGAVPTPRAVIGFDLGTDRVLANYTETRALLDAIAAASPRVRVADLGPTVEGRRMVAAVIASPANLARLDELKRGWTRLADTRGLAGDERSRLLATLPSCVLIVGGIHSNEVAGTQSALLLAYQLAAAPDGSPEAAWLEHTVVLVVPSVNPDGQEAVVGWYRKTLGTPSEGSNPPFLYHRYAGHDNNRDFVFLTQPESRDLNRFAYREWHPQVFLDMHQMGMTGPRQFVPPFAEPLAPNVHPLVWRMTSLIGAWMSLRLEEQGKAGVVSGWMFDGNWIGGTRNTGWWKNVFGLLTETAGAALASPVAVDENELKASGKGLQEYRAQVNFPNPWRGGSWGLADAVGYQTTLARALVELAALHRRDLLDGVATMAAAAVEKGEREAPAAYLVPPGGADPGRRRDLVNLLLEAGVEARITTGAASVDDGIPIPAGTIVFPAAQPLRQYLVEVMERQRYPQVTLGAGDEIALPYDITAWTMPLYLGVEVRRAERAVSGEVAPLAAPLAAPAPAPELAAARAVAVSAGQLAGYAAANRALAAGDAVVRLAAPLRTGGAELPAGTVVLAGGPRLVEELQTSGAAGVPLEAMPEDALPLHAVRVGVYNPNFGLEDAGWSRWVLERGGFAARPVYSAEIASGSFARDTRVLVVPPLAGKVIVEGSEARLVELPKEYRGGIGKEGVEAIRRFLAGGGTVIGFGESAEWLAEVADAPVTNVLRGVERKDVYAPGALLDLEVDGSSPLGWGMPAHCAAMVDAPVALETRPAARPGARSVTARFPDGELVLSGWMRGEERLRRRAAAVEVRVGNGRLVLFSFAPYFRGQTEATFPLLYNAVMEAMADTK